MDDSLLSRAFDVKEISDDFDPSIPPSTGHEYLQHVMYEASKCPKVVVAEIDRTKFKNPVNVNVVLDSNIGGEDLAPSADWEHEQIAIFSDLRRKVELSKKLGKFKPLSLNLMIVNICFVEAQIVKRFDFFLKPKIQNEDEWYDICFGDKSSSSEPSLTLLLSISEPVLEQVLEYQLEWLEDSLRPNQGKWIYALLACLSLPLTPVTCSTLRDMARQCVKIRNSGVSLEENVITSLNLIICLVRKYFGQMDLMR